MPPNDASPEDRIARIEQRLERLEREVADLRAAVETASETARPPETSTERDEDGSPIDEPGRRPDGAGQVRRVLADLQGIDWLSYVGVGLLLFGLVFLFKYSIERGWLVPGVRVGFGGLMGGVLLAAGLLTNGNRQRLRQILLGGSVATFYGTLFAAYQLYGLVSYPVAFGGMVAVTGVAIGLALRQDHASMAVLGTIGGLGTPFLLYSGVEAVGGFAVYTGLVLGGACAVYLDRGWRSLVYTAAVGGWGVFLVPCVDIAFTAARPAGIGLLQAGLVVAWLLLGGTPVTRALLNMWRTDHAGPPSSMGGRGLAEQGVWYGVVGTAPGLFLVATRLLWTGSDLLWAAMGIGGTLVYAGVYLGLRRVPLPYLAPPHGLVAALLATYALSEVFGGVALLLAWAVEAGLLLVLARRLEAPPFRVVGHALFVLAAGWLGTRFAALAPDVHAAWSLATLGELAALGMGTVALGETRSEWRQRLYQGGVLVGWLGWGAHVLAPLPNGQAYVSLVWGLTAAGLLVGGAWFRYDRLQVGGLATLAVFVGKLFLVDLAALPALWRIALFLGAGGAFLLISYSLPGLQTPASADEMG